MSHGTTNLERRSRRGQEFANGDLRAIRIAREAAKLNRRSARREAATARREALAAHQAEQAE